jgi:hypothetical protein
MLSEREPPAPVVPPVPGFLRLGWLLFMQPIKLHELYDVWGLKTDPSLWILRGRFREPVIRVLVLRLAAWLFFGMPVVVIFFLAIVHATGSPAIWFQASVGVFGGVVIGVSWGVAGGVALGTTVGVTCGVALGVAGGASWGVAGGIALGVAVGEAVSRAVDEAFDEVIGRALCVASGVAFGVAGVAGSMVVNWAFGWALIGTFLLGFLRLPTFLLEAPFTWLLSIFTSTRWLTPAQSMNFLSFRHHDLVYFPLPGLRSLLVTLGQADVKLGRSVIAQAAVAAGQKRPVRLALEELQSLSLANAGRARCFARAARLDLPFLPAKPRVDSPLCKFQAAASDLRAYEVSHSHDRRKDLLINSERVLEDFRTNVHGKRRPERLERLLLPVARTWLELVAELRARLAEEMRQHPQVPTPFMAGPVLSAEKPWLFKGRKDLVGFIDHDLAGDRRGPLWLCGQRRMGKSSLLEMLPIQLGSGTTVVKLNFQGLSGSPYKFEPHRLLATEVAKARPEAPALSQTATWGLTLDWLRQVDEQLAKSGTRLLIAIDEVERLQDGIAAGWASTDFLDFVRAAGDALRRIRLLLVSAYPLARLGPHWPDRLISALSREITYLKPDEARELVCHPTPDFPNIYPEGAVDHLLAQTNGHPYLIQLVCDELCRRLNEQQRLHAEPDDMQAAIDAAFGKTSLFDELWRQQNEAERTWLRSLAAEPRPVDRPDEFLRSLTRTYFVEQVGDKYQVAVPMFAAWIRDH